MKGKEDEDVITGYFLINEVPYEKRTKKTLKGIDH
jgi:hypothetical protein